MFYVDLYRSNLPECWDNAGMSVLERGYHHELGCPSYAVKDKWYWIWLQMHTVLIHDLLSTMTPCYNECGRVMSDIMSRDSPLSGYQSVVQDPIAYA